MVKLKQPLYYLRNFKFYLNFGASIASDGILLASIYQFHWIPFISFLYFFHFLFSLSFLTGAVVRHLLVQ